MKNSLSAFMQKANSVSVEYLKNSIKGGYLDDCHCMTMEECNKKIGALGNSLEFIRDSKYAEVSQSQVSLMSFSSYSIFA